MPHIAGHPQNSMIRVGKPFPKKVGVLYPLKPKQKKSRKRDHYDFPILFFRGNNGRLEYGIETRFHPCLLEIGGTPLMSGPKYYVIATDVVDPADEERAVELTAKFIDKNKKNNKLTIIKLQPNMEPIEGLQAPTVVSPSARTAPRRNSMFRRLLNFAKKKPVEKAVLQDEIRYMDSLSYRTIYFTSKNKRRSEDQISKWIIDNAVPFDDMNLGTN